jgi:hypothetical protein
MKITARGIGACMPLLLGLALVSPASAQSAAKSLKQQIVGHWQLVSVTVNSGTPYGAAPQGSMFLDAGGHVSVIVISDGGARNISYFGTYTVDDADKSVSVRVDGSSGGAGDASGRTFKRLVQLQGDEMIVANATPAGGPGPMKLIWKQAN